MTKHDILIVSNELIVLTLKFVLNKMKMVSTLCTEWNCFN